MQLFKKKQKNKHTHSSEKSTDNSTHSALLTQSVVCQVKPIQRLILGVFAHTTNGAYSTNFA